MAWGARGGKTKILKKVELWEPGYHPEVAAIWREAMPLDMAGMIVEDCLDD